MYNPAHFTETDRAEIDRLMQAHPLATLVTQTAQGLDANHLPLLRDGEGLLGHVARANPLHEELPDGAAVLAIFRAAEGYVSPNWYPSKAETHQAVPTWNYRVVHVHATLHWSHETRDKRRIVNLLTTQHERAVHGAEGWRMGDAPADYLAGMLDKIVAFRLSITRIEAKDKLSQNRSAADVASVAAALQARGQGAIAAAMRGDDDQVIPGSTQR